MCNPTTGSPTITLFQLRSNYHTGLEEQVKVYLVRYEPKAYPLWNKPKRHRLDFGTVRLFERDGRCVQSLIYHSPQHTNLRLLMIPSSCKRVSVYNSNLANFYRFASNYVVAPDCF